MRVQRWAELSVKAQFLSLCVKRRPSSSEPLTWRHVVLRVRSSSSFSVAMAEEAKKLAAHAAVDNHIQVGPYFCSQLEDYTC